MDNKLAEYIDGRIRLLKDVIRKRNTPGLVASYTEVSQWRGRLAELEAIAEKF